MAKDFMGRDHAALGEKFRQLDTALEERDGARKDALQWSHVQMNVETAKSRVL